MKRHPKYMLWITYYRRKTGSQGEKTQGAWEPYFKVCTHNVYNTEMINVRKGITNRNSSIRKIATHFNISRSRSEGKSAYSSELDLYRHGLYVKSYQIYRCVQQVHKSMVCTNRQRYNLPLDPLMSQNLLIDNSSQMKNYLLFVV